MLAGGVFTACNSEGDDFDYNKSGLLISGTENNPVVKFVVEDTPASYAVTVQSTKKVTEDVKVELAIDASKVDEYNATNGSNYVAAPEGSVELLDNSVTISEGSAISSAATVRVLDTEGFVEGRNYVVPVTIKTVSNGDVIPTCRTIYLRIARVISFYAIQANYRASSNFIFDQPVPLTTFTYEVKIYPQGLNRRNYPQRFLALEQKDESKSLLLRFNEANSSNKLQTILAGNKIMSNTEFENGNWYLLTWVYDGTNVFFYVNGTLDTSGAASIDGINFQRYEMGMSYQGYNSQQFFSHRFCELRIWNRALSTTEINANMCGADPQSEGLVAYWKFNEGEGHVFKDASNHGMDMDWSKTKRAVSGDDLTDTPTAADNIQWVKDDINKCSQ